MKKKWYVVQVHVGREDKVRKEINRKVKTEGRERSIGKVLLHRHPENVARQGKLVVHQKKSFPGYLLVEMVSTPDSRDFIKSQRGVICFLSNDSNPIPLSKEEVKRLVSNGKPKVQEEEYRIDYSVGDYVEVVGGPFKRMQGKVLDIDEWKPGLIRVNVELEIMGKKTKVDMNWKELMLL